MIRAVFGVVKGVFSWVRMTGDSRLRGNDVEGRE